MKKFSTLAITAILVVLVAMLAACGKDANYNNPYGPGNNYAHGPINTYGPDFRHYPGHGACSTHYGHRWQRTWDTRMNQAFCLNTTPYMDWGIPSYQQYFGAFCLPHAHSYLPQCPIGQGCALAGYGPNGQAWGFCASASAPLYYTDGTRLSTGAAVVAGVGFAAALGFLLAQ